VVSCLAVQGETVFALAGAFPAAERMERAQIIVE